MSGANAPLRSAFVEIILPSQGLAVAPGSAGALLPLALSLLSSSGHDCDIGQGGWV